MLIYLETAIVQRVQQGGKYAYAWRANFDGLRHLLMDSAWSRPTGCCMATDQRLTNSDILRFGKKLHPPSTRSFSLSAQGHSGTGAHSTCNPVDKSPVCHSQRPHRGTNYHLHYTRQFKVACYGWSINVLSLWEGGTWRRRQCQLWTFRVGNQNPWHSFCNATVLITSPMCLSKILTSRKKYIRIYVMKQDSICSIYNYISYILCMRNGETLLLLMIHNNTNRGPLTFWNQVKLFSPWALVDQLVMHQC